jgi:hypothetical protein
MKLFKPILIICMSMLCQFGLAGNGMPPQTNLPPPDPVAPRDSSQPLTGNDSSTQLGNSSDMNTVITESTGTSGDYNPTSHPIPLEKIPKEPLIPEEPED